MYIVGVTGGIASGKTVVTDLLAEMGISIIDADVVAREVVKPGEPVLDKIARYFGDQILDHEGSLDRSALRTRVFVQPEERAWLESLLHPLIRNRVIELLNSANSDYAVLSSPLLLETDQHSLVQHIVVIDTPVETQIERAIARDGNTKAQVQAIMRAQISRTERLAKADTVIMNDSDVETLRHKIMALHQILLAQAKKVVGL